jgi:hypothetical protein
MSLLDRVAPEGLAEALEEARSVIGTRRELRVAVATIRTLVNEASVSLGDAADLVIELFEVARG